VNFKTPQPIVTKFGMGDYVGDVTPYGKIQSNRKKFPFPHFYPKTPPKMGVNRHFQDKLP